MELLDNLSVLKGELTSKVIQRYTNPRPFLARSVFENREKSIGATGFEPAT